MIIVDTSAIVAIAQDEPEREAFTRRISTDGAALLPASAYVEASIVINGRFGAGGRAIFEAVLGRLQEAGLTIYPLDTACAEAARTAFRTFGKGRHAAGLNFGDCLVYATARILEAPLLFKGDDFAKTDLTVA
jgi:ribonuclease VapC